MSLRVVTVFSTPSNALEVPRPLFTSTVPAGFPSPADDYIEGQLDLNRHLIKNSAATYFVRVSGDSMTGAGIHSGDLLVVDRSLEPKNGNVVVAVIDGELVVKRLRLSEGKPWLIPDNGAYPALEVRAESEFRVWGVVTNVVHPV